MNYDLSRDKVIRYKYYKYLKWIEVSFIVNFSDFISVFSRVKYFL